MDKFKIKDVVEKIWPKTKKELEKMVDNTKTIIEKGENYIKTVSEKSAGNVKKISLNLQKEKLYYRLGKTVSSIPASKWKDNSKINTLLKEIKSINREIKKIS